MSKRALPAFLFLACSLVAAESSATLEGKSTRLTLLSALSSKSPKASEFRARLEESVQVDGEVLLPQGTLFEGHVEPRPARRMIRSGALRLVFDRMVLPDGTVRFTNTSLTSIDYKGVKTDSEGTVRPRLSKKRLLVQVGGALLIAKVGDDLSEVAIATVTKNGARFFGLGAAVAFVLLQKGGEVKVPQGTGIEITFGREGEVLPMGLSPEPPFSPSRQ